MQIRYLLLLRQAVDLLFERCFDICHETMWFWWNRFGPLFAADIRKRPVGNAEMTQPCVGARDTNRSNDWRRLIPWRLAARFKDSMTRRVKWLSVGCATALVCTVVPTVIRSSLRSLTALVFAVTAIVSASRTAKSPAPIRSGQRVIDERSNGERHWKCVSPHKA